MEVGVVLACDWLIRLAACVAGGVSRLTGLAATRNSVLCVWPSRRLQGHDTSPSSSIHLNLCRSVLAGHSDPHCHYAPWVSRPIHEGSVHHY